MNNEFTSKMLAIQNRTLDQISNYFKEIAVEAHVFGSIARETNDALSDIDIWLTFKDEEIKDVLKNRMMTYAKFGEIVLVHELQNNFPLDGIQTAIIYKIEDELIRVDFYLCPLSSSRVLPHSKILFEKQKVEIGDIIPETKRIPKDLSDRVTFFISMCFIGIKKVMKQDKAFVDFLLKEFKDYEKEIPGLSKVPNELTLSMLKNALSALNTVSNKEQKVAISEISDFMTKVESAKTIPKMRD